MPDFFSSSALFSCFVQHLDCCWCYLCDFSMTYLAGINQIGQKIPCSANKKGPPEGDPFFEILQMPLANNQVYRVFDGLAFFWLHRNSYCTSTNFQSLDL